MTQEIEIEFKNLLTEHEYNQLLTALPFPNKAFSQTNYYFETDDFQLKEKSSALRIREKQGKYQLTLKQPHGDGLLETHDSLTKEEAFEWLNGHCIAKENIQEALKQMGIPLESLRFFGSLTTERREYAENDILYVLDYSTYNHQHDYELEIEAPTVTAGENAFQSILTQFQIPKRQTKNKIERLFISLMK
ncbi:CYTH domain-containing protein [Ornithinibacillus halophilus]|uniref:Uncharacterized protein YjbK n=1 Tax=Ornithinibacillus halophilus TaxID=930117 RepID=A0A1M5IS11_9BACI|nr:CYTH domain-containing protein [Ornithinibacillus halophilus]SHG30789.1 Uncharacterized protein YjbK [Ornithinibacillus halophilus]